MEEVSGAVHLDCHVPASVGHDGVNAVALRRAHFLARLQIERSQCLRHLVLKARGVAVLRFKSRAARLAQRGGQRRPVLAPLLEPQLPATWQE